MKLLRPYLAVLAALVLCWCGYRVIMWLASH